MAMVHQPYETMEGQGQQAVRQLSVFVTNQPGQLLRMTQVFERKDIRILALSVVDSADCAVVRLLVDLPEEALKLLTDEGWAVSVSELVVVRLPHGKRGLLTVLSALLSSEVNIAYAYPLLPAQVGPAMALHVDNIEIATDTLMRKGFQVLGEADLQSEG